MWERSADRSSNFMCLYGPCPVIEVVERCLYDLCWAVNSPSLLGASELLTRSENASLAAWHLSPDEIDLEHLRHHLSEPLPRRTGRYFEQLILYWLEHVRGCRLVEPSLPVRDGKRTMGEIDVLFFDEDDRLTHWELALKFYLLVAPGKSAADDYVGPNARDTLQRKVTRLVDHQLPLSRRYFPDVEVRQAFVKGRIFYPWLAGSGFRHPEPSHHSESRSSILAADHLRGRWLRSSDVETILKTTRMHYRVLEKPFWLAEDVPDQPLLSSSETIRYLQNHFSSRHSPVRMTGFSDDASPRRENVSLFVVADHWPNDSPAAAEVGV